MIKYCNIISIMCSSVETYSTDWHKYERYTGAGRVNTYCQLALTLLLMLKLMRVSETTNKICFVHVSITVTIFGCFPWDTTCPEKQ